MLYNSKKYKIENIKKESSDVKLIKVKCNLNPSPGRFFEISIPGIGECPLASCIYDKNHINILLKNAGNVTSQIFNLEKNDYLYIRGPYGNGFPIEKLKNKNLILVAGGTGIAPITSMINYIEKNKKDFKKIFIYFGFRDKENILLKEKIKKWKKIFNVYVGLSEKNDYPECEKGFIEEIIKNHKPEINNTIAVLCGPEIMMQCVTSELNKEGLQNNKIYWSMERRMECAFGSCGRCQIQDLYVCKDGPVFRYDIIKPRLDNEGSCEKR